MREAKRIDENGYDSARLEPVRAKDSSRLFVGRKTRPARWRQGGRPPPGRAAPAPGHQTRRPNSGGATSSARVQDGQDPGDLLDRRDGDRVEHQLDVPDPLP